MSAKTDRQAIFGTDDESSGDENDHEDTNPADSVKPGRGAPKTDSRVWLTVQEKMEAVKHFHDNKGMTQAALIGWCFHKFQMKKRLGKGTVSSWFKEGGKKGQKEKIEKAIAQETSPFVLQAKSFKGSKFPKLEQELFSWFRRNETKQACLTDDILNVKAKEIAERLNLDGFKASSHWIQNFKHRFHINVQVLHGEAASADGLSVHVGRAMLPELLKGVDPHDIYNMDETGLNYRALPKRSLGSQPRKGCKLAKERATAVLCTNATGTHRLPLMIIGSAAKPQCFSNWDPLRDANVVYESNKSSWMDRNKFTRWINDFNNEMKSRGKTGWLLMDNSSTHGNYENARMLLKI